MIGPSHWCRSSAAATVASPSVQVPGRRSRPAPGGSRTGPATGSRRSRRASVPSIRVTPGSQEPDVGRQRRALGLEHVHAAQQVVGGHGVPDVDRRASKSPHELVATSQRSPSRTSWPAWSPSSSPSRRREELGLQPHRRGSAGSSDHTASAPAGRSPGRRRSRSGRPGRRARTACRRRAARGAGRAARSSRRARRGPSPAALRGRPTRSGTARARPRAQVDERGDLGALGQHRLPALAGVDQRGDLVLAQREGQRERARSGRRCGGAARACCRRGAPRARPAPERRRPADQHGSPPAVASPAATEPSTGPAPRRARPRRTARRDRVVRGADPS